MSRLNVTLVAEREAFARRFFNANPLKGVREMNEELTKAHPGGKMGLKRAYELEVEIKGAPEQREAKVQELIKNAGTVVATVPAEPLVTPVANPELEAKFKAESDARTAAEAELAKVRESLAALTSQNAAMTSEVTDLRAKLAEATKPVEKAVKGPSLKTRIVEALATGPSNAQGLAAFLGVTGATLRGRIAELVKEGKVTKGEDGNFSLKPAEAAPTPTVEATEVPAAPVAEPAPVVAEAPQAEQAPAVNG